MILEWVISLSNLCFLWIIKVQCTNYGFLNFQDYFNFKISDIGLLWSKITIFIIEISLKLQLHTKYGWNNPNSCRLGLKSLKLHFLFLTVQKFITHTNIQIHVKYKYMSNTFNHNFFFRNAHNNVLYQNQ